jgi:hypothetical protein
VKHFTAHGGRLRRLPLSGKLLYTTFLLLTLVGLWVSMRLYGEATDEGGARGYYSESVALPNAAHGSGGPSLDLPADSARMSVPMSERKLLEVTHFHLFSVPVYFLIVAHLFLLAGFTPIVRTLGAGSVVVSSVFHVAAPWLVRGSGGVAWLMPVSGIWMGVSYIVVIFATLVDMWLPHTPS